MNYTILSSGKRVTLQVGERHFQTTVETLSGSLYFSSITSGRWDSEIQADGSYFLDADPAIFEHTLRYLRSKVYPIFYESGKGFDYGLYASIQEQADFLLITPLAEWIKAKKYLLAVQRVYNISVETHDEPIDDITRTASSTTSRLHYFPDWEMKTVWACPRRIHDDSLGCGKQCSAAAKREGGTNSMEIGVLRLLVLKEETLFDTSVCQEEVVTATGG